MTSRISQHIQFQQNTNMVYVTKFVLKNYHFFPKCIVHILMEKLCLSSRCLSLMRYVDVLQLQIIELMLF